MSILDALREDVEPPLSNTGVYPSPNPFLALAQLEPKFDWYQATVMADDYSPLEVFRNHLGGDVEEIPPLRGYRLGRSLKVAGSSVMKVFSGGKNRYEQERHVLTTSDDSPMGAELLRAFWPEHRVTRADVAIDVDQPGVFDWLHKEVFLPLADERLLPVTYDGDWHRNELGRTVYLASRKSAVHARLYEKGKQLRQTQIATDAETISTDLTRIELQVRPNKRAKSLAAKMEPIAFFGFADWSIELIKRLTQQELKRVHINERRESDDERALYYAATQYHAHFERLAHRLGGWEYVGDYLHQIYLEAQAEKE